ncbi:MAG TPA: hypothetical protein PLR83_10810 [Pyrinomonadaceae bacterium]|nr:hypothetical protein [Pyrinomonadaceae bacterium]
MVARTLILALIGAIGESVSFAICCYFASILSPGTGGTFFSVSEPEKLYAMAGGVVGAVFGFILGVLIGGLNLNIGKGLLLSFGTHLIIGILFIFWTGSDPFHELLVGWTFIAIVLSGLICGLLVTIANHMIFRVD